MRRQRDVRKQTKWGLKDRWRTPEIHKQKRKMKCVVGGGGPLQWNHHIFSSRKGYNLPKATKKGQLYRIRCQLYLGSQYNFYSVSPPGDVHFVVHSNLFQSSKLIQKHLFDLKRLKKYLFNFLYMEVHVKICCLSLQIVKTQQCFGFCFSGTWFIVCLWLVVKTVHIRRQQWILHFHRSSGPWMDHHG